MPSSGLHRHLSSSAHTHSQANIRMIKKKIFKKSKRSIDSVSSNLMEQTDLQWMPERTSLEPAWLGFHVWFLPPRVGHVILSPDNLLAL